MSCPTPPQAAVQPSGEYVDNDELQADSVFHVQMLAAATAALRPWAAATLARTRMLAFLFFAWHFFIESCSVSYCM